MRVCSCGTYEDCGHMGKSSHVVSSGLAHLLYPEPFSSLSCYGTLECEITISRDFPEGEFARIGEVIITVHMCLAGPFLPVLSDEAFHYFYSETISGH